MTHTSVEETIAELAEESPSYDSLLAIYYDLQTPVEATPERTVCRRALAQMVGEIIDYLDYTSDNIEKMFGVTREEERKRILDALEKPTNDDLLKRTYVIVSQWDELEKYDQSSIQDMFASR